TTKRQYSAMVAILQPIRATRRDLFRHHHRRVYFRLEEHHRSTEPFRGDAGNCEVVSIDLELLSDQIRIAPESGLPAAIADDRDRIRAGDAVFLLSEHPAFDGPHTEQIEIIARYQIAPDTLVDAVLTNAHRAEDI